MSSAFYAINHAQLRQDGVRLSRLAAAGQIVLVMSLLAIPFFVYAIAQPAMPDLSFRTFLKEYLITGPFALANAYEVVQGIALLITLGCTRHLGKALSSENPLGRSTLDRMKWLGYSLCTLALMLSIGFDDVPALPEPKLKVSISLIPLYFGAMTMTGLSIARRIISEAVSLKTETQEFI